MFNKKSMLRVAGVTAFVAVIAAAGWYLLRPTLPLSAADTRRTPRRTTLTRT